MGSVISHIAGTPKGFGRRLLTVGDGGDFSTIAAVLEYMSTQPTMELIATAVVDCNQWDNFVPLVSGSLADARPGDLLYVDNDDPGIDIYQYDWHYYRVLSAIDNASEAMPGLYLESGILGPDQLSKTVNIYRPAKFHILLLNGNHTGTGATMPDGYEVLIAGMGRGTTVDGIGIYMPIYGHTEFTNFIQTGNLTRSDSRTLDAGNNLLDAGFATVDMHDMWCEGEDVTVLGNASFQSIRMKNIGLHGFKGHRFYGFIGADFIRIEDIEFDSITSMELFEMIKNGRRCDSSHKKIVKNCRFRRSQDHSSVSASGHNAHVTVNVAPVSAGMPPYEIDFINTRFIDDNLNVQARNKFIFGFLNHTNPSVDTRIRFIDSELINDNSHTYDIGKISGYTVNNRVFIEFIRTRGVDDKQITHNFVSGEAVVKYDNPGSYVDLAYAAGIVPSADLAETILVGQLTGNVTVLAPTNSIKGQKLRFVFEQDSTGGRTIAWNALYLVNSNPVGGADESAVFEFFYDGTSWIQTNTAAWA